MSAPRFDVSEINMMGPQTFSGADPEILSGRMGLRAIEPVKAEMTISRPSPTAGPGGMA